MFRFFILILFSAVAQAEITIVMKGSWVAECTGGFISFHNRYDKALQSAINQNTNCNIVPPLRFEIRNSDPIEPNKNDITLSWDLPTDREDGSQIDKIDKFKIYQNYGGVELVYDVHSTNTEFKIIDVQKGAYTFEISTVEDGQEGAKSAPIDISI